MTKNPIPELIDENSFRKLDEAGIFEYNGLRNYQIIRDFTLLRKTEFKTMEEAENILSDKYFITVGAIHSIIYLNKKTQKYRRSLK